MSDTALRMPEPESPERLRVEHWNILRMFDLATNLPIPGLHQLFYRELSDHIRLQNDKLFPAIRNQFKEGVQSALEILQNEHADLISRANSLHIASRRNIAPYKEVLELRIRLRSHCEREICLLEPFLGRLEFLGQGAYLVVTEDMIVEDWSDQLSLASGISAGEIRGRLLTNLVAHAPNGLETWSLMLPRVQGGASVWFPGLPPRPIRLNLERLAELCRQSCPRPPLQSALAQLRRLVRADDAEILLLHPPRAQVFLSFFDGIHGAAFLERQSFRIGQGFPGLVVEQGKPMATCKLPQEQRFLRRAVKDAGIKTYACVPLWNTRRPVGSLNLAWSGIPQEISRAVELLAWIAMPISLALEPFLEVSRRSKEALEILYPPEFGG